MYYTLAKLIVEGKNIKAKRRKQKARIKTRTAISRSKKKKPKKEKKEKGRLGEVEDVLQSPDYKQFGLSVKTPAVRAEAKDLISVWRGKGCVGHVCKGLINKFTTVRTPEMSRWAAKRQSHVGEFGGYSKAEKDAIIANRMMRGK